MDMLRKGQAANIEKLREDTLEMTNIPKLLIIAGIALIAAGVIWMFAGRFISIGRLPGDIHVEKGNFSFYFPVVTCIIISVLLSVISWIVRYFMK